MINLLPESYRSELRILIIYRRALLYGLFGLVFLSIIIGILFVLKNSLASYSNSFQELILLEQKKLENTQLQGFRELIVEQNTNLSRTQNFWKEQVFFTPLLEKLFQTIPLGIYLKELSLTETGQGKIDFSIKALADSRETLFQFRQRLQAAPEFSNVDFSAAAWLKPLNIDFLFKLTYTQAAAK